MFCSSIGGNMCFALSILLRMRADRPAWWIDTFPYVLSCVLTVATDLTILLQASLYRHARREAVDAMPLPYSGTSLIRVASPRRQSSMGTDSTGVGSDDDDERGTARFGQVYVPLGAEPGTETPAQ